MCRDLGVDIGMYPGKGYSFSVDLPKLPSRVVHLGAARAVLTPMGSRLRVAGTMELDRDHDRFRERRIRALVAAVRPYLRDVDWADRQEEWVGSRTMTPDGLPLIGTLPGHPGILLATGHNMLGPSTGRLITDLLTDPATAAPRAAPFSPARLARRTHLRR
ncbi:NAD(P)/FAD-dependent oxidoreductase [Streptomyces peucetius]|uniref:FAD-dependent oxidoreductase n=1 Tax=Streptomyces peucetius TaxID=1950 RepID=A0ABY6IIE8_STRPE|nr:FAD-dependent oxidoreductase [Streptomyces peucetius]UYQ66792.1 FAD-dependent oxidoreductase [Streptomyces peucetius]